MSSCIGIDIRAFGVFDIPRGSFRSDTEAGNITEGEATFSSAKNRLAALVEDDALRLDGDTRRFAEQLLVQEHDAAHKEDARHHADCEVFRNCANDEETDEPAEEHDPRVEDQHGSLEVRSMTRSFVGQLYGAVG